MATIINSSTSNGLVMTPDTSGEIELQANGVTKAKVTANGLQDANGNSLRGGSFRNLIINGDMSIAQRGSSLATTNSEGYIIDRYLVGSFNGNTVTYSQNTDVPSGYGFTNSIKVTNTTGTAASTFETICQRMEGLITSQLDFGSASAKQITLSFWVKSSVTGTYNVGFRNSANNRGYVADYTILSANTWEKKSITITGDTTGTWLTTNGIGIRTFFVLGASAGNSTTPGAWSASANMGSSNLSNTWTTTSGATFYITGVQLEVGEGASDFEFLPYDVQLARCQRYYNRWSGANAPYVGLATCMATGGTNPVSRRASWSNPVEFRAKPTLGFGGTIQVYTYTLSNKGFVAFNGNTCNKNIISFDFNSSTAGTGGQSLWLIIDSNLATNYIDADAEL